MIVKPARQAKLCWKGRQQAEQSSLKEGTTTCFGSLEHPSGLVFKGNHITFSVTRDATQRNKYREWGDAGQGRGKIIIITERDVV